MTSPIRGLVILDLFSLLITISITLVLQVHTNNNTREESSWTSYMHGFQQAKETFLLVKYPMRGGLNNQLMAFVAYGEISEKANRAIVLSQFLGNFLKENVFLFPNQGFPSQLIKLQNVPANTIIKANSPTLELHK